MKKLNIDDILSNTQDLNIQKLVGFISIIGRPNTGKSTFVNSIIGEKISICSKVPQTTRQNILAIYNDTDSQIIFFDTPGIHKSEKNLNIAINGEAISSLSEADVVLYFIDSTRQYGEEEEYIEMLLKEKDINIIKVYTKSDLNNLIVKSDGFYISSISGDGIPELLIEIKKHLKMSEIFYPEDMYTKQDIYFRINEIIREKIIINTREEIPHSIYVETEDISNDKNLLKIASYIYTDSESQKFIIIGKGGELLKKIGTEARLELEGIFGSKVFLSLRVKVNKNWKNNKKLLNNMFKKSP